MVRSAALAVALVLALRPVDGPAAEASGVTWLVDSVHPNGDLALAGGLTLRPTGIRFALTGADGTAGAAPAPDAVRARIAAIAVARPVQALPGGFARDRFGRLQGEAIVDGRLSLQLDLVASGLAVVDPGADPPPAVVRWLVAEAEARAARRGLWAQPSSHPTSAELARQRVGRFALVEGVVVSVERRARATFLNFGDDWRSDFTAGVAIGDRPAFRRAGVDLDRLAGRRVRLRGTVRWWNGPYVDLEHPAQLELLGDGP